MTREEEFVMRLAVETPLTCTNCISLIKDIQANGGDLETLIDIYDAKGLDAVKAYQYLLRVSKTTPSLRCMELTKRLQKI